MWWTGLFSHSSYILDIDTLQILYSVGNQELALARKISGRLSVKHSSMCLSCIVQLVFFHCSLHSFMFGLVAWSCLYWSLPAIHVIHGLYHGIISIGLNQINEAPMKQETLTHMKYKPLRVVDGSEIPSPTTSDVLKAWVNSGISYQPQLVRRSSESTVCLPKVSTEKCSGKTTKTQKSPISHWVNYKNDQINLLVYNGCFQK